MFNNKKLAPYIFVFLFFCVISSKHIIIYNEEILVALSFLFFVIFVSYYFQNTIKESLDERTLSIRSELQNFLNVKKQCVVALYKIHLKANFSPKITTDLISFTFSKVNKTLNLKALKTIISKQINLKLKNLFNSNVHYKFQKNMYEMLYSAVLVKNANTKTLPGCFAGNIQKNIIFTLNSFKKIYT